MSAHKVAAVFESQSQLESALDVLHRAGFVPEEVSLLLKPDQADARFVQQDDVIDTQLARPLKYERTRSYVSADGLSEKVGKVTVIERDLPATPPQATRHDPSALVADTAVGGLLGLLSATALMMIPGIGQVIAIGPLATGLGMLTGSTAAGASLGAMLGILRDEGIPAERVELYRDAFDLGQVLLILHPRDPGMLMSAYNLLASLNPVYIESIDEA